MTHINIKSQEEFIENIKEGLTFVMISKENCGYCEKGKPIFEKFSKKYEKRKFLIVKNEVIPDILEAFQVKMYPTFVAITNGKVDDVFFGDTREETIEEFIQKNYS